MKQRQNSTNSLHSFLDHSSFDNYALISAISKPSFIGRISRIILTSIFLCRCNHNSSVDLFLGILWIAVVSGNSKLSLSKFDSWVYGFKRGAKNSYWVTFKDHKIRHISEEDWRRTRPTVCHRNNNKYYGTITIIVLWLTNSKVGKRIFSLRHFN